MSRLAAWYECQPRPRLVLALVVLGLYLPSLAVPFFVDDYHSIRVMREYRAGRRAAPDVYRFFTSDADVARQRELDQVPWWFQDPVRAELLRPLSEWSLYLDYLVWGARPAGYHLTAVMLYLVGVWLVLALFRAAQADEARARWAALIYAVGPGHAIAVIWVAARADVMALVTTLAALLAGLRFARRGGVVWLAAAGLGTVAALFSKEASLPIAAAWVPLWLMTRSGLEPPARARHDRRCAGVATVLLAVTAAWLAYRQTMPHEVNNAIVLNPLAWPGEYLRQAPARLFAYLSTWPVPGNPVVLIRRPSGPGALWLMGLLGLPGAILIGRFLWRRYRRDAAVIGFAVWPWLFLPVLACALPDGRLMILPYIGLAYLGAVWLLSDYDPGRWASRFWLRVLPAVLMIVLPAIISAASVAMLYRLEAKANRDLAAMAAEAGASSPGERTCVFPINTLVSYGLLVWARDRAELVLGDDAPAVSCLCDLTEVDVEVTGPSSLRLTGVGQPFLFTLPARLGTPHGHVFRAGESFEAPEFVVTIAEMQDGYPMVLDFAFDDPLDSPRYHLYGLTAWSPPRRWRPEPGERVRFSALVPHPSPGPP